MKNKEAAEKDGEFADMNILLFSIDSYVTVLYLYLSDFTNV